MKTALVSVPFTASLGANSFSGAIYLKEAVGFSAQAVFTGTPSGSFKLQTSLDYQPGGAAVGGGPAPNPGTWVDYPSSSQTVTTAGSIVWNITDVFVPWMRIAYVFTSGSGTLTELYAFTKGV